MSAEGTVMRNESTDESAKGVIVCNMPQPAR